MTTTESWDYIIVGAGSSGCALAARLSEDPAVRVLLLEAGPRDRDLRIRVPAAFPRLFKGECDWDLETEPQPELDGRRMYWPRGRVLGGCSSMNAMIWVRGSRADYDGWAAEGCAGWGWKDVLPYFRRCESWGGDPHDWRGSRGPIPVEPLRTPHELSVAFLAACAAADIPPCADVNGDVQDGAAICQVTQRHGERWSAAAAYLRPARGRSNLEVRTGARVRRVIIREGRAVGVDYVARDQPRQAAAGEVVLAAGAVASPQLLMLSGIGPAEHLGHHGIDVVADVPGVGAGLQDHLAAPIVYRSWRADTLVAAERPWEMIRWLLLRRGLLASNVAEAFAFLRSRDDVPAPDLELLFAPAPFVDHGLDPVREHGFTVGAVLLQPASRGSIRLAGKDPFAPPIIEPGYLSDPEGVDQRRLLQALRRARDVAGQLPLARQAAGTLVPERGGTGEPALRRLVREHAQTLYHPVGTCRMGIEEDAVVDPWLRVRGVEGLRVADASIMPRIPRAHTHAPAVMIGEKAADILRGRGLRPAPQPAAGDAPIDVRAHAGAEAAGAAAGETGPVDDPALETSGAAEHDAAPSAEEPPTGG